jgi:hypothetical protein
MNFVSSKQRQQWLGRAEDYADIVSTCSSSVAQLPLPFLLAVPSTNEIHLATSRSIVSGLHIHRGWHPHVDAVGPTETVHDDQLECRIVHRNTLRHYQSLRTARAVWNDLSQEEN